MLEQLFITNVKIEKVRHLKNIQIPLSKSEMRHLIFTGKNGSGKTSVLKAMAHFLHSFSIDGQAFYAAFKTADYEKDLENARQEAGSIKDQQELERQLNHYQKIYMESKQGVLLQLNSSLGSLNTQFENGEFLLAYYEAERKFETATPRHIEKVELKEYYTIEERPRQDFVKYLRDLKMTEALALTGGKHQKAAEIKEWFTQFQDLLRNVFEDRSLELRFDEDTFEFYIYEKDREPFDFNTLSGGYAAVLDIIVDIILRMETKSGRKFQFNMPGIILIDEIETHLHLELQRNILKMLTAIFPNIQFVVSTHSPFILNSLEHAVIYDLENHLLVEDGLSNVPYDGIVEGYFKADSMSALLRSKFEAYKSIVEKDKLSDEDFDELARLEMFLDEIPDYLALGLTTEYQRLKMEFESREDF